MKEVYNKNIFLMASGKDEAICIDTNYSCKKDGHAVMGKGYCKKANELYNLSEKLGQYLKMYGNRAFDLGLYSGYGEDVHHVLTFPTKNKWWEKNDINLIKKSAEQIIRICNARQIKKCYLPPVGTMNNGFDYDSIIKPIISNILDDRFIIVFDKKK